jgi:hypothetical protein
MTAKALFACAAATSGATRSVKSLRPASSPVRSPVDRRESRSRPSRRSQDKSVRGKGRSTSHPICATESRGDRSRGMRSVGKGAITAKARVPQQRRWRYLFIVQACTVARDRMVRPLARVWKARYIQHDVAAKRPAERQDVDAHLASSIGISRAELLPRHSNRLH